MPRIARVVAPGCPHHVTQRGNRRADVFGGDDDRRRYLSVLSKYAGAYGLEVWAYCLMTNHVHFVAVPKTADALGRTFRDTHQAYASWLNRKTRETGHLWQGRFHSTVVDDPHLWAAVRYVERNPGSCGDRVAGRGLAVVQRGGPLRAAWRCAAVGGPDALARPGLVDVPA